MIRFAVMLTGTTTIVAAVMIMASQWGWIASLPSFFYQTITFLWFTTIVIVAYLFKADKPDFFVQLYLLSMAVKFVAYGGYVTWMILEDKKGSGYNVAFFMILYILFTALEIIFLHRKISRRKD